MPADDSDALARIVHDQRLAHEADQAAAEGRKRFIMGSWDERAEVQRELDRRIASAVAARAVHDAGIDLAAKEMEVLKLRAQLARVQNLADQLATAAHPTVGGTFAAGIGLKFQAILGSEAAPPSPEEPSPEEKP